MTEGYAISAERASVRFPLRGGVFGSSVRGYVSAVDDVNLAIKENETVALVGESGSGKTTLAMSLLGLRALTSGTVLWRGRPISDLGRDELKRFRRDIQIVFQDPYASLNPRQTIYEMLRRPLALHGLIGKAAIPAEIERLVDIVGLKPASLYLHRFPHEFSGGQRQRIAIARALALQPTILIADEPVSALDVSIRTQILKLLRKLKAEFGLSMLFLSHDLGVVRFIADRVAVMYLGKLVEIADVDKLFREPKHPYTRMLLSTAPSNVAADQRPEPIAVLGDLPSPSNPPSGCRFRTRCPFAFDRCSTEVPALKEIAIGQSVACHLSG